MKRLEREPLVTSGRYTWSQIADKTRDMAPHLIGKLVAPKGERMVFVVEAMNAEGILFFIPVAAETSAEARDIVILLGGDYEIVSYPDPAPDVAENFRFCADYLDKLTVEGADVGLEEIRESIARRFPVDNAEDLG